MYEDKKLLLIMRHAKSDPLSFGLDFDRPINKQGQQDAIAIANQLNIMGLRIERALISPAQRTVETWEALQNHLHHPPKAFFEPELYNAYCETILAVLRKQADDCHALLLIGHNPGVSEVCELLSGELPDFKPASLAILSTRHANLSDSLTKVSSFHLEVMLNAP